MAHFPVTCPQGTAFFALQSCFNHSCAPSVVAEGQSSGSTSFLALTAISPGAELSISYIDEEGSSYRDRQAALRDYGFKCSCERCLKEKNAKNAPSKRHAGKKRKA